MHPDLCKAILCAYEPNQLFITNYVQKAEGAEYGAARFEVNNRKVVFRVAKITPTKAGLFVTVWKRPNPHADSMPYDITDPVDFFIISVKKDAHLGQFIFPKEVLLENGILSKNHTGGKRGFRLYPPWETDLNRQAEQTQKWQMLQYVSTEPHEDMSLLAKRLA